MKKCFLTAAMFLWTAMASADDAVVRVAVVRVNGDVITGTDVEAFIASLPREVAAAPIEDLWAPVIERMTNDRLVVEEARRRGHQNSGVFLAEVARFEAELLRQIYYESLITLSVADAVVRQAYDGWVESLPEEVHASHILVETHEEARAIAGRARAGEDFAGLARDHSIGPSAPSGGDLGWFGPGVMVPDFEAAAWALAPGEVSGPVETQFGWHVIRLQDRRTLEVPPFADMEQSLREDLVRQTITDDLERLRSSASIEILTASPPEGFGKTE